MLLPDVHAISVFLFVCLFLFSFFRILVAKEPKVSEVPDEIPGFAGEVFGEKI